VHLPRYDNNIFLVSFYPDFIQILSRLYPDFLETHLIQILSRFYMDKIEIKSGLKDMDGPVEPFLRPH
jgi:hypothetical protein